MTKKFYELALKSPGLKEMVKVDVRLSKKSLLFFARILELGLNGNQKLDEDIMLLLPAECKEDIRKTMEDLLKKGELEEFYAEVNQL